jgi:hypothetical protein
MRLRIVFICVLGALAAGTAGAARRDRNATEESSFFVTSDRCIACHSTLSTAGGEDISIGYDWRSTIMANSGRDPYWHAAVRREVTDHPVAQAAIEDKCSTCHMPMMRFDAAAAGGKGQVFASIVPTSPKHREAFDSVSCTVCHQIEAANLGTHASLDGGFEIDKTKALGERTIYGPNMIEASKQSVMRSATQFLPNEGTHIQQSELCATCHTLYTSVLDEAGQTIGELPEQVPYQEWSHSEYRSTRSCQSCHMPVVAEETPISSILGQARPHFSQHTFRGGNAFILGILNKYRGELGVIALPQELDTAVRETKEYLKTSAHVAIDSARVTGNVLEIGVGIESQSGHKLPTAYPARRVWLHLTVKDAAGATVFESGAWRPNGSIVGNDNDSDGTKFEPHYMEITSPEQVQIYESIMVDPNGQVTTGLLHGMRYVKDNRLLPRGFDKSTADAEVAVHGGALDDQDFVGGGDHLKYRVDLGRRPAGALTVEADLVYQSIGFRWAENLKAYDTPETNRFVRYYGESVPDSVMPLASASATVR